MSEAFKETVYRNIPGGALEGVEAGACLNEVMTNSDELDASCTLEADNRNEESFVELKSTCILLRSS